MFVLYIIICLVGVTSAEQFSYSSFVKTQVIFDTCDGVNELSRRFVKSVFQCHMACSENINCRRVLHCSSDFTCILYLDGTHCGTWSTSASCSCYTKVIGCRESGCTCPLGYYGNNCQHIVKDCKDAENRNVAGNQSPPNALVYIKPQSNQPPVEVPCILNHGGGLVIMNRYSNCLFENFNTTLSEYEQGFGIYRYNRWLGFNKIKAVMANYPTSDFLLQVILSNSVYENCHSYYNKFQLGDRSDGYRFSFYDYNPGIATACGDALASQRGFPFTTSDDDKTGSRRCAQTLGGGWWFNNNTDCTSAFLTGTMDVTPTGNIWNDNLRGEMLHKIEVIMWIA